MSGCATIGSVRVIATAGHVDHGKSSLVLALTGTDPDRFAEEKRRGLTIDLGFAHACLDGEDVSFVDVPGHVRFLRNMLAGVGGVDACLFVVAATEGWKPQSEEHLRILELVGVRHGVIALTKVDVLDDADLVELATLDVAEHVVGTFLDGAPIVAVAAPRSVGLDALATALADLARRTPAARDRGRARLWIDRAFAARGSGTVVTGTLTDGAFTVGDRVVVEPGGTEVARPGDPDPRPGGADASDPGTASRSTWPASSSVPSPGVMPSSPPTDGGRRRSSTPRSTSWRRWTTWCHGGVRTSPTSGPASTPSGCACSAPSRSGRASRAWSGCTWRPHCRCCPATATSCGRPAATRRSAAARCSTWRPCCPASRARPDRDVERVIAERGWVDADELELLTGERRVPTVGGWVVDPVALGAAVARLDAGLDAGPVVLSSLDDHQRAVLDTLADVVVDATTARRSAADPLADHPVIAALAAGGLAPSPPAGIDRRSLRQLAGRGVLVERDGLWWHTSAIDEAGQVAARLLTGQPDGFTVAQFREASGITRKHAVPLLAELDARAVTRRRGDVRIAGPRLPTGF